MKNGSKKKNSNKSDEILENSDESKEKISGEAETSETDETKKSNEDIKETLSSSYTCTCMLGSSGIALSTFTPKCSPA